MLIVKYLFFYYRQFVYLFSTKLSVHSNKMQINFLPLIESAKSTRKYIFHNHYYVKCFANWPQRIVNIKQIAATKYLFRRLS